MNRRCGSMRLARTSAGASLHGATIDRLLRAARLRNTDTQRASLVALQDASAKAADMLKTSCQAGDAITPPARLADVGKRLDTMLQAIKLAHSALDDLYGTLSDEQKAQFEAIGPQRTASSDQPDTMQRSSRRHHRELFGN